MIPDPDLCELSRSRGAMMQDLLYRYKVLQANILRSRLPRHARQLRLELPGALYHVTSRGNAQQDMVEDDRDRSHWLALPAHVIDRYGWLCHAYCQMGNHYHVLIETPQSYLSLGMCELNGRYTQAFNHRHERVGHLFQGRFTAILVEKEAHLLELCR